MKKIKTRKCVISFRVTPSEKEEFEKLITILKTTKSQFLRKRIGNLVSIFK